MGYLDKIHKKAAHEKQMQEIFNDYRFKQYLQAVKIEAQEDAFDAFVLITARYLCDNFRCKEQGVLKFLDFADEQMKCVEKDANYFLKLNDGLKEDIGMDWLNARLKKKGEIE